MKRTPSRCQISTSPISSSIGEQFWNPKKIAVRPSELALRTSSAVRPCRIRSGWRSNRRPQAERLATVSRKFS